LRVLQVVQHLGLGGAEQVVIDLARGLALEGCEVEIASVYEPGERASDLSGDGICVHTVGKRRGPDPQALASLVRLMRRLRPEVVHTHTYTSSVYGRVAATLARVPVVVHTEHAVGAPDWHYGAAGLLLPPLRWVTACTVVFSEYGARQIVRRKRARPGRVAVIPNGVPVYDESAAPCGRDELRRSLGVRADQLLVLSTGGLRQQKRFDRLVDAAGMVPECWTDRLLFAIAGTGPLRDSLRDQIATCGARVLLLGPRDDIRRLTRASDIYLCTSEWESMPLSALEAMADGLPVVGVDIPGLEELLADGRGILTPAQPAAIARALAALAGSEAARRAIAEKAKEYVRAEHSVGRMVERHAELYRELLAAECDSCGNLAP